MSLSLDKKRLLIARAHNLKPVIILGHQGITEGVIQETDRALTDHELIKVRVNGLDKAENTAIATELCDRLNAHLLRIIGKIAIIQRPSSKHKASPKSTSHRKQSTLRGSKANSGKGKKKPKSKN